MGKLGLFAGQDDQFLAELLQMMQPESFNAGQTICSQGAEGDKFYLICEGRVEVLTTGSRGEHLRVSLLGDGQYFGEISLLRHTPRIATVKAVTECHVLSITRDQFDGLLERVVGLRDTLTQTADARSLATSAANETVNSSSTSLRVTTPAPSCPRPSPIMRKTRASTR